MYADYPLPLVNIAKNGEYSKNYLERWRPHCFHKRTTFSLFSLSWDLRAVHIVTTSVNHLRNFRYFYKFQHVHWNLPSCRYCYYQHTQFSPFTLGSLRRPNCFHERTPFSRFSLSSSYSPCTNRNLQTVQIVTTSVQWTLTLPTLLPPAYINFTNFTIYTGFSDLQGCLHIFTPNSPFYRLHVKKLNIVQQVYGPKKH